MEKNGQRSWLLGIYLVAAKTFGFEDKDKYGFDALMEFPPHTVESTSINSDINVLNKDYNGYIFSYDQVVKNIVRSPIPSKTYNTSMLSWDNTARKQDKSNVFHGFTLQDLINGWIIIRLPP